jgi:hypothetical protein
MAGAGAGTLCASTRPWAVQTAGRTLSGYAVLALPARAARAIRAMARIGQADGRAYQALGMRPVRAAVTIACHTA